MNIGWFPKRFIGTYICIYRFRGLFKKHNIGINKNHYRTENETTGTTVILSTKNDDRICRE